MQDKVIMFTSSKHMTCLTSSGRMFYRTNDSWAEVLPPNLTTESIQDAEGDTEKNVVSHVERFEEFWSQYPKKISKPAAKRVWSQKRLDNKFDEVVKGLDEWKRSFGWLKDDGTYITNCGKWLRNEMWKDNPNPQFSLPPMVKPSDGITLRERFLRECKSTETSTTG